MPFNGSVLPFAPRGLGGKVNVAKHDNTPPEFRQLLSAARHLVHSAYVKQDGDVIVVGYHFEDLKEALEAIDDPAPF